MCKGSRAYSPAKFSIAAKAIVIRTKPTKGANHVSEVPCIGHPTPLESKVDVDRSSHDCECSDRSMGRSFSFQVATIVFAEGGTLNVKKMIAAARPQMGRLTKKHHLQETCSVKAPPRSGPTIDAVP